MPKKIGLPNHGPTATAPLLESSMSRLRRPTREEAEEAVRTLISYIGDDPEREGLRETPKRVVNSYAEYFAGYHDDPEEILSKTFEEVEGYDEIILLKNMRVESHCEHHMVPIIGKAHIAYLPDHRVVGISKIARLLDVFAKRLQTQETMTAQIALTIDKILKPRGVAVLVDSTHQCMTTRGVHKTDTNTVTYRTLGVFRDDPKMEERFLRLVASPVIG